MEWFKRIRAYTLIELMIVVAIIGILASIAIPAFTRYMRRSRTSEALSNIRKIYDGEIAYYQIDHVLENGNVVPSQFVEAGPTPETLPGVSKVMGDWSSPQWEAIKFAVDSPVLYMYEVESQGTGRDALFFAVAQGDIDGDQVTSRFSRKFHFDPVTAAISGGAGVYVQNELE